jgi:thiol-disulfide isomerase/thioredoxin
MRRRSSRSRESAISNDKAVLTLFSRQHCHLCQEMLAALDELRGEFEFVVNVIDIDYDPLLEEKFNELVPVLEANGTELCHYFLDAEKVRDYLADRA